MSHILIIGKSFSGIKRYLELHGHTYTVLQDRLATKFPDKRLKNRVVCDFSSTEKIIEASTHINTQLPIDAVMATYENYIMPAAIISRHLNLPGMPIEAAQACTDKELMRAKLIESPVKISPAFRVVDSPESLEEFAKNHSFPFILKPANLSKSLLVSKCSTMDELMKCYQSTMRVIEHVYAKYSPNSAPKLLIEEFMQGSIHSVDAFIDANGTPHVLENVVDYETGYDIGYNDNFHYSRLLPSTLDPSIAEAIRETAALGCKALGMKSSPAHIEIIVTKDGPRIVEIGARNGGYRERMHMLANGIDITYNALALALGQPLNIRAKRNDCVGVFELFPRTSGIFVGIKNEENLRNLPSLEYLSIKASPGDTVGLSSAGYKMSAVVILTNHDANTFEKDRFYLKNYVEIITSQDS